jgi:hypothetical protein
MIQGRVRAIALVLLVGLTGCVPGDPTAEPNNTTATRRDAPVENALTWQKAKARTQAMELEIAKLIPEDKVVKIDQWKTGILLSCSETQHDWNGATTVTLSKGTEPEPLVKAIEAHYQDSRFTLETDVDIVGDYRVQLRSPDAAENYIIVKDDPGTISIDSGSACFTLPEGEYPGGDF